MERGIKRFSLAGIAAVLAAVGALFFFNPETVPIYPVCLFHRLTDLNCPGCGSLRAIHQLLHGNFLEALRFNAMLVFSIPLFAWVGWRLWRQRITGTEAPAVRPAWLWIYAGAWVVFGVVRELPIKLFAVGAT